MKSNFIKGLVKIKLGSRINNISQIIEQDFKQKNNVKLIMTYANDLPKHFKTKYPKFDEKTAQMISHLLEN